MDILPARNRSSQFRRQPKPRQTPPTFEHALVVAAAGADIVAIDGTRRRRPFGLDLNSTIDALHERTRALVVADIGGIDDGLAAIDASSDCLSTTLCGYRDERKKTDGPDLDAVHALASRPANPIFAEGRVGTPADAAACLAAGAFTVVVGTAITHPTTVTARFRAAL